MGCDIDPLAAGIRLAEEGSVVPRYDDPSYVAELCRLAHKYGVGLLVSTIAAVSYTHLTLPTNREV